MKRFFYGAALIAALGALATLAMAQRFHGDGVPLAMLWHAKAQLNLNTSQQQQWDAAVAQSQATRAAARASFAQVHAALQAELAKPEPDFASVAALSDSAREQIASQHKQSRDAWLALYANFTPEQKATARDAIKAGLDRMAAHEAMHSGVAPPAAE